MSDAPQGEGWWQASDGKWYPPQDAPQPAAAPAQHAGAQPGWQAPASAATYHFTPFALPVATAETIPGREIVNFVGPVVGVICRSMGIARGFTGGLKALSRGEVTEYTATLSEARHEATVRMVTHASSLGGNAVVAMRYDSGDIGEQGGLAEIVAYGTAVVVS